MISLPLKLKCKIEENFLLVSNKDEYVIILFWLRILLRSQGKALNQHSDQ
jgi:hypothetical protein